MTCVDRTGRLEDMQRARTEAMEADDMIAYWAIDVAICRHLDVDVHQSLEYLWMTVHRGSGSELVEGRRP